ncbi:Ig-like domain-containing protein [Aliikangiella coralliicola]|uniref:chitinase n=1 Tax=Aliikangiella coralliicola TaxID=2592383 RepID=A0A545U651_9GAMM|nr:Ig-like domain-containing protein [Aliikangiella coralliicola]TQV84949.1 chitinase [Aliikangiella coralliicola]
MNLLVKRILRTAQLIIGLYFFSFMTQAAESCVNLEQWQSNKVYHGGDRVQYSSNAYSANYWTQGNNPETSSGPWEHWKLDGPCDDQNQAPSVSILSPDDGSFYAAGDSVVISADASDRDGNVESVEFFVAGSSVAKINSAPYSYEWTASGDGSIEIRTVATDDAGAQASASVVVNVGDTTNVPPTITLTSPSNGSQFNVGDSVTVSANASDSDGSVESVSFYIDDALLASDSTAPYSVSWLAETGTHEVRASALDDKGATTNSLVANITVNDGNGQGKCADVPAYQVGGNYSAGDQVVNVNHLYRCDIAGWCSSNAAWAYEPGVGAHWQQAWTDEGECGSAPEVVLTSPTDNAVVLAGAQVNLQATANDVDGTVTQVEFFVNDQSVAVDTSKPYAASWTASGSGETQVKALATDNEGRLSNPSSVMVTVSEEPIVASITSPSNGTVVKQNTAISITADASSITGNITEVIFMVNGAEVARDTSAPYSASWQTGQVGNYSINVKATDDQNNSAASTAVSVQVVDQQINDHVLVGYWHNFVNGAGCPMDLSEVSDDWDVIVIAFADNDRNSNGTVHFNLYSGDIHSTCDAIDPDKFKQDILSLQARGKKLVLSLGGAEGTITLNTDSDQINFVSSLTQIIQEWKFDGLDVDLESGSNLIHGSQIQARLPGALKQIQSNIGGQMYLSMAPEHPYVQGGMVAYSGIWGAYIPLIDELRSDLDLLHVQLYNNGGLTNPYTSGVAPEGSIDMMVAASRMLIEGFELADGSQFQPLRADQVAIGLPSGPSSANSGQASIANIVASLDCIMLGTSCDSFDAGGVHPTFGGVMTWSINWDKHDGFNFSKPVAARLRDK